MLYVEAPSKRASSGEGKGVGISSTNNTARPSTRFLGGRPQHLDLAALAIRPAHPWFRSSRFSAPALSHDLRSSPSRHASRLARCDPRVSAALTDVLEITEKHPDSGCGCTAEARTLPDRRSIAHLACSAAHQDLKPIV